MTLFQALISILGGGIFLAACCTAYALVQLTQAVKDAAHEFTQQEPPHVSTAAAVTHDEAWPARNFPPAMAPRPRAHS